VPRFATQGRLATLDQATILIGSPAKVNTLV
jgi:hypothetical protein